MPLSKGLSVPSTSTVDLLRELATEQPEFVIEQSLEVIKNSLPDWEEVELDLEIDLSRGLSWPTREGVMDATNAEVVRLHILPSLPPNLATDERLWVALTFGPYRDYVRARFPAAKSAAKSPTSFLENHYLCGGRNFKRSNAIAHLWWLGELSTSNGSHNREMTEFLMTRQEIYSAVIDRPKLFTSAEVRKAVVSGTQEFFEDSDVAWNKTLFRKVMKELDFLAGRKFLPSLRQEDLTQITKDLFESKRHS